MPGIQIIQIQIESSSGQLTSYLVSEGRTPTIEELPWKPEECDAFVIVLDARFLADKSAVEIAEGLLKLPVDWIETFGARCEFLHDLIDEASVSIGRQKQIGDGNPMTAWPNQFSNIGDIISYIRTGGQGASERKVVVVVGPERSAAIVAKQIAGFSTN